MHENPFLCVCWVDIKISGSFGLRSLILGHPIDSCHNTTFFLGLTGSNISLWCYFWKYLCLIFSGICHPAAPSTISDRWILWKTDRC
jgi:hypothetical protein